MVENSQAIVDPALRERLMRPVAMLRVCLLANVGDAVEAERVAAPIVAALDAEFGKLGRVTKGEDNLWSCLSFAQRQNGRYAEAVRSAKTIMERCRAEQLQTQQSISERRRGCEARPLSQQALAELDWGRPADALATMERRLKLPFSIENDPNATLAVWSRPACQRPRTGSDRAIADSLRFLVRLSGTEKCVCRRSRILVWARLPCGRRRARALDGGRGQANVGDLQAEIAPSAGTRLDEPCLAIADR